MHHALEIPEIRHEICLYCCPRTLSNLACTASAFREPAQGMLWRSIGFFDLIRALPSDVARIEWKYSRTVNQVALLRPIPQESLRRLARLAGHVKTLSFVEPDIAKIPSNLLDALLNTEDVPRMFPRLDTLHASYFWGGRVMPDVWTILRRCLGPNLGRLTMDLCLERFEALAQQTWLNQLHIFCPKLRGLTLSWASEKRIDPETVESLASSICRLDQLQHLSVPALNTAALTYISTLSSLKSLSISEELSFSKFIPPSIGSRTFSSLTDLDCHGSLDMCISMMQAIAFSPLYRLRLTVSTPLSPPSCRRIFSSIASQASKYNLHELILCRRGKDNGSLPCTLDTLEPILSLRLLTTVKLFPPSGFSLSDEDIERIARSWPELESLDLVWPETPLATLQGLAECVRRCPCLSHINIPFSASVVPRARAKPAGGAVNSNICTLNVGVAPIDSPSDVALFLSSLFPRLDYIVCSNGMPDSTTRMWDMVQSLLPNFVHARRQERDDWSDSDSDD